MNENTAPETAAKPVKKLKRHFLIIVLLLAFVMILAGQILGELITQPMSSLGGPAWSFLLMYLSFIGIHIITLFYCALAEKPIFRSFWHAAQGGGPGNTLKLFGLGLVIGFLMNGVCILLAWLHKDLHFSLGSFQFGYLLVAFLCVLVQSAAEELVTRGYMMGALRERYPVWVAVAANSLFFAALHLLNPGITVLSFLNIVMIGLCFSLVMVVFDSLWMCVALHTAWNFTQNLIFGLPNSGIVSKSSWLHLEAARGSLLYDAVFGVEGSVTALVVEALFIVCIALYGLRKKKQREL